MNRIPCLLVLLAVLTGAPCAAQTSKDSTASPDAGARSAPQAYSDSASRVAADTGRPADSSRTDSSKAAFGPTGASADAASAATNRTLVDSSLVAACHPSAPGSGVGGVLLVIFTTEAAADDKQRAVKAIGGRLAGQASTGGDYVAIPDTTSLRDAADLLIQQPGISQISERPC